MNPNSINSKVRLKPTISIKIVGKTIDNGIWTQNIVIWDMIPMLASGWRIFRKKKKTGYKNNQRILIIPIGHLSNHLKR